MARKSMADLVREDTEDRTGTAAGQEPEGRPAQPAVTAATNAAENIDTTEQRPRHREAYGDPSPERYGTYDRAPAPGDARSYARGEAVTRSAPPPVTPEAEGRASRAPAQSPVPKYLRMQRIDGRIREDQYMELVRISKSLNRQKRGGERITPNTLVRIGIDLLLAQEHAVAGSTETEIRDRLLRPPTL